MDIGAMVQTSIKVLTQPGEAVFLGEKDQPYATLVNALVWIVIAAVIAGVLGFFQGLLFVAAPTAFDQVFNQADFPPEVQAQMEAMMSMFLSTGFLGASSLISIVWTPIAFLILISVIHLAAKMLGGAGDYGRFAYLVAAFQAPISVVGGLLGFVPLLGSCIAVFISIYGLVLSYFATRANYGLSSGRAIVAILVPLILLIAVAACIGVAVASVFLAGSGGAFN